MARHYKPPAYRLHKQSDQAVVTLPDINTGKRPDHLLGVYGSPESRTHDGTLPNPYESGGRVARGQVHHGDIPLARFFNRLI